MFTASLETAGTKDRPTSEVERAQLSWNLAFGKPSSPLQAEMTIFTESII